MLCFLTKVWAQAENEALSLLTAFFNISHLYTHTHLSVRLKWVYLPCGLLPPPPPYSPSFVSFYFKSFVWFSRNEKIYKVVKKGNVTISHSFRMELYDKFYSRAIINLCMELSVFYMCSNFWRAFGPRTRTGIGPTQKTTNWMFQSKAVILKSPSVCHYWAAQPQYSTPSPLKFSKHLGSPETASQKQMWSWSGAWIQALSPLSMWNQKGLGTEQLFWHCGGVCSCPNYLQLPHVPPGGTMLSELPTLPPLHCMRCSNSGCVRGGMKAAVSAQRTQWAPGCSRGCVRSPLTPANQRNLAHGLFLTQNAWVCLGRSLQKSCHDPGSRFSTAARSATYSLLQSTAAHLQEVTPGSRGNIQESGRSFRSLGSRHPRSQPKHQDYPGFFNSCCSVNFSTRLGAQHCGLTF